MDFNEAISLLPQRDDKSHKNTFGHLLIIAGSKNYMGAASLCCKAALRSGCGLVTLSSIPEVNNIVASKTDEVIYLDREDIFSSLESYNIILVGCGLGQSDDSKYITEKLILQSKSQLVLDADSINSICENPEILKSSFKPVIITPHLKEFSRISNVALKDLQINALQYALAFSNKFNCITVLKNYSTIITTPNGKYDVLDYPNSGLSKGGSGDVLSGIIASLLAQGMRPFDSVCAAVSIHSKAGQLCSQALSKRSMLPSDIIDILPSLL